MCLFHILNPLTDWGVRNVNYLALINLRLIKQKQQFATAEMLSFRLIFIVKAFSVFLFNYNFRKHDSGGEVKSMPYFIYK